MELDSSPQPESQRSAISDLFRNWLHPKGIDTSGDVNLHDYKGWKIEAPKIMLTRAKHFLADEDVDRTVDWPQKFAELAEYFSYLEQNFQGEDWGEDLHEAVKMLHTHWVFEQYHYGRPELTLDFPNVWPDQSKRLPQLPGTNFTMEAEDLSDDPMGQRKLILTKIKSAHDFQYQLPRDILKIYINAYGSDAREFWNPQARSPPAAGSEGAEELPEPPLNMVKCDNEYYDRCIQGGMKTTSDLMKEECKFKFSGDDIIRSPSGPSQLSVQSLESFAKFRGARRAALEQCLNIFNNAENRLVSSSWNTLMLPSPKVPEEAPGILFPGIEVRDIPKDEARDPLSYTLAHNWFVKEDHKWAQWARPHSIKGAYGERLWRHRDDPIMDLPVNYKGPYVEHFMDTEMKRVFDLLRSCGILHQRLQRAQRWAPRYFLADVLKLVENMSEHGSVSEEELPRPKESGGNLMHLRPEEEKWLHFLGGPSINKKLIHEEQTSGRLELLFEARVDEMLDNIDPNALFRDTKPVTLDEFLTELNRGAQGPVRRHQFSGQDAIKHAKRLSKKGKLQYSNELVVSRPEAAFHPEDRVRWLASDQYREPKNPEMYEIQDERPNKRQRQRGSDSDSDTASQSSDDFTISTEVSVDKPMDYGEYTVGMPKLRNIYTWEQCLAEQFDHVDTLAKTQNFLRCLAYRLGATLREMRKKHRANRRHLTKSKKLENRDFVRDITKYWIWDAEHLPNDSHHNENYIKYEDVTPRYEDVVQMADPEAYRKGANWWESISQNLIREVYENKDMLHPTRVMPFKGADGKTRDVTSRPSVWTFAHPDHRPKARQFWDINRWPLHLQSEETEKTIRSSGPRPQRSPRPETPPGSSKSVAQLQRTQRSPRPEIRPGALPQRSNVEVPPEIPTVQSRSLPAEFSRDIAIPYSDPDVGRRGFRVGVPQFWAGDTPLQRKVMEETARENISVLEPPPETRRSLFSVLRRRREPDDPTALPEVDPRIIPKSKPRDPAPESESPGESSGESSYDVGEGPLDGAEEESQEFDEPQGSNDEEEDLYDVTPPVSRPPSPPPGPAPVVNPPLWQQIGRPMLSQSLDLRIVNSDSGQSSGQSADGDMHL
ncbi:hypothetical protein EDB80DRAFT_583354 [Ilyonectria destructans]|nr:hypothetical protein EDB80DRAFT_583354 [Ilyonectria destructans]